jgi:hypothetical protein
MPLEHLEALSVLEADDVVREDGFLDRNRRDEIRRRGRRRGIHAREGCMDRPDEVGDLGRRQGVVRHVGGDDISGHAQDLRGGRWGRRGVGHDGSPVLSGKALRAAGPGPADHDG